MLFKTAIFEIEVGLLSLYLRLGRRGLFWSSSTGLTIDWPWLDPERPAPQ